MNYTDYPILLPVLPIFNLSLMQNKIFKVPPKKFFFNGFYDGNTSHRVKSMFTTVPLAFLLHTHFPVPT